MIINVEKNYDFRTNNFVNYKVTKQDGKVWFVPLNESNTDYQAILKWIEEGGIVIDNNS